MSSDSPSHYPIRVLVVDDRPENLTAMQAALADLGCSVVEATSGREALEIAASAEFAVILLDVQMPDMDGFETARRLRRSGDTTPVIFVTAIHRSESYEEIGYGAGAVDFLFKPLNITILQAKVAVFADLYRKTQMLKEAAVRERENALLKQAIADRDEFLSIASHELKTPITPLNLQVQSLLQIMKGGAPSEVPLERRIRMLESSQKQIDRLSRLIDEMIEISRMKHGPLLLKRKEIDLCDIVSRAISFFEAEFKRNGCAVQLNAPAPVHGNWDPFRLDQVLINLLSNAVKYGAGKPIALDVKSLGDEAVLTIRDHGIGIPEADQSRIFERYERAVSSKNYGGLGLGLYISRNIIEAHGGTVTVQSRPGAGAEFTIRLPANQP